MIANRISIDEVIAENGGLRLMKNLVWEYDSLPHALICGGTGGGKTYFLLTIIERSRGRMLMYGREAQSKTRIASPATIPKQGNHKAFPPLFRRIILWYNLKYRAVRKALV